MFYKKWKQRAENLEWQRDELMKILLNVDVLSVGILATLPADEVVKKVDQIRLECAKAGGILERDSELVNR